MKSSEGRGYGEQNCFLWQHPAGVQWSLGDMETFILQESSATHLQSWNASPCDCYYKTQYFCIIKKWLCKIPVGCQHFWYFWQGTGLLGIQGVQKTVLLFIIWGWWAPTPFSAIRGGFGKGAAGWMSITTPLLRMCASAGWGKANIKFCLLRPPLYLAYLWWWNLARALKMKCNL